MGNGWHRFNHRAGLGCLPFHSHGYDNRLDRGLFFQDTLTVGVWPCLFNSFHRGICNLFRVFKPYNSLDDVLHLWLSQPPGKFFAIFLQQVLLDVLHLFLHRPCLVGDGIRFLALQEFLQQLLINVIRMIVSGLADEAAHVVLQLWYFDCIDFTCTVLSLMAFKGLQDLILTERAPLTVNQGQ